MPDWHAVNTSLLTQARATALVNVVHTYVTIADGPNDQESEKSLVATVKPVVLSAMLFILASAPTIYPNMTTCPTKQDLALNLTIRRHKVIIRRMVFEMFVKK